MDETSIKLYQDAGKGALTKSFRGAGGARTCRPVSRGQMRTAFTLAAVMCDDETVQREIPQVLVINTKTITANQVTDLHAELGSPVVIWRKSSAWLDIPAFCSIVKLVGISLAKYRHTHVPILGIDAAKLHLNERVWRIAADYGILLYIIPAKVTWGLQPADVYLFATFKMKLRMIAQEMALAAGDGRVSIEQTIRAVSKTVDDVLLNRKWASVFSRLGLDGSQASVSANVLRNLKIDHAPSALSGMPTLADLLACWPAGSVIPVEKTFLGAVKVVKEFEIQRASGAGSASSSLVTSDAAMHDSLGAHPQSSSALSAPLLRTPSGSLPESCVMMLPRCRRLLPPASKM